jgi:hypothetical protein
LIPTPRQSPFSHSCPVSIVVILGLDFAHELQRDIWLLELGSFPST